MDSTQYECMSFFFNDTATTEIYTLSLHDALPICFRCFAPFPRTGAQNRKRRVRLERVPPRCSRQYRCSSREFCEVRLRREARESQPVPKWPARGDRARTYARWHRDNHREFRGGPETQRSPICAAGSFPGGDEVEALLRSHRCRFL